MITRVTPSCPEYLTPLLQESAQKLAYGRNFPQTPPSHASQHHASLLKANLSLSYCKLGSYPGIQSLFSPQDKESHQELSGAGTGVSSPSTLQECACQIPAAAPCQRGVMRRCLQCSTNPQMNARHLPGSWLIRYPAIRQPTHTAPQLAGVASWGVSPSCASGFPSLFGAAPEPGFGIHPKEAPPGNETLLLGFSE